ncbi:MAG: glyceraldehyde-3-phosphate dehydrogenase [Defluviimonas sp.]|nr:glyceraldehyde-3-phosphate dehydrogenase [Paracoccaceae bacterium]MCC0064209.1 glyceraldehyde-3-phosphate dehydrogenase [Defluviimonas sp.]
MTNRIAFVLAALVVLLIVVDLAIFAGAGSLFLARKLSELIEWLAFWR